MIHNLWAFTSDTTGAWSSNTCTSSCPGLVIQCFAIQILRSLKETVKNSRYRWVHLYKPYYQYLETSFLQVPFEQFPWLLRRIVLAVHSRFPKFSEAICYILICEVAALSSWIFTGTSRAARPTLEYLSNFSSNSASFRKSVRIGFSLLLSGKSTYLI